MKVVVAGGSGALGRRCVPRRLLRAGFEFDHPDLAAALRHPWRTAAETMTRVRVRGSLSGVAVLAMACSAVTGCGGVAPPAFRPGGVSISGEAAHPGILGVFSADLTASHPRRITLERMTLLPLPGFRLPRLAHVSVLYHGRDIASRTVSWPPATVDGDGQGPEAPVMPLAGADVWPASRGGLQPPYAVYGLSASGLGGYAAAGVRLVYMFGGRSYTATINDAVFLWYSPRHLSVSARRADARRYRAAFNRAYDILTARKR